MDSTLRNISREIRPLLGVTLSLLLITAVAYPLAVTGIGQAFFHRQANGSVIERDGQPIGSSLLGQTFTRDEYFHPRPSAAGAGYDASSSSGSNLGPTSAKLIDGLTDDPSTPDVDESFAGVTQRVAEFRRVNGADGAAKLPSDSVTASASGLDPHISPATARLQVARVAAARGVSEEEIRGLLDEHTEGRTLWLIGEPRVNVLKLNLALDERFPVP